MSKIDWIRKVYGDGQHNAFTDMVRWGGSIYICFRHGTGHISMDGVIKVLYSTDLQNWKECGCLTTLGDDRDPHFTATEDELRVYFGTADIRHNADKGKPERGIIKSHFCTTLDGKHWTEPQAVYKEGCWLWRVEKFGEMYYSAGYETIFPGVTSEYQLKFLQSSDGLNWLMLSLISDQRHPDEAAMFCRKDGHILAITRMEDEKQEAFLFESDPPYRRWVGTCLEAVIHSPAIVQVGEELIVAGRSRYVLEPREKNRLIYAYHTSLWRLEEQTVTELITVPSEGDNAYPGLVADGEDAVLISWYSMHDQQAEPNWNKDTASIYLARITL